MAEATLTNRSAERYTAEFERVAEELGRGGGKWLAPLRRAAMGRFKTLGFPTTRDEAWRFSNLAELKRTVFAPCEPPAGGDAALEDAIRPHVLDDLTGARLVFINGLHAPALSRTDDLPKGVILKSLASAIAEDREMVEQHLARHADFENHAFTALNTALARDGAFLFVPRGMVLEAPIRLVFVVIGEGAPRVAHPRNLIVFGENSQATVLETYAAASPGAVYFNNAVSEFVVGAGAVIDHYKLQSESDGAFHIATTQVHQERASSFTSHFISLGGAFVRNEVNPVLEGEGCQSTINGLYLLGGTQHLDNHTRIDHASPNCESHELYKGILAGRASGVFTGRIIVRPDAQKTNAFQSNRNLLLSDTAAIDTQPQLEIFADDVKCSHGATVGQLDSEAVFYLRTRGIAEHEARGLLTYAFANEIIEKIAIEPLRRKLERLIFERYSRRASGGEEVD